MGLLTEIPSALTLQAALEYARYGWRVVPVFGTTGNACECSKRDKCPSPGKHPRIREWQNNATCDEEQIAGWLEKWPGSNIGVRLGPDSGIVDIEFDDDQGRKLAERILGQCYTPTFASSRSVHRLFRWNDGLPRKTVPKIGGLECRLGQDERGAQTVFPPSRHASGLTYRWLDGLSPSQVEVAEIPDALLSLLVNQEDYEETHGGRQRSETVMKALEAEEIREGGRNEALHAIACLKWRRQYQMCGGRAFSAPDQEAEVWSDVWAFNNGKCRPPLDRDEAFKLFRSARDHVSAQVSREESQGAGPLRFNNLGLEFKGGEWWPGLWRIEIYSGYETSIHLYAPFGGPVKMNLEQFNSPAEVHMAVLKFSEGKVCLKEVPGRWETLWHGTRGDKNKPPVRGLMSKLLETSRRCEVDVEMTRQHMLAEHLMSVVGDPTQLDPTDVQPHTKAFVDQHGGVWFRLSNIMAQAKARSMDVTLVEFGDFLKDNGVIGRNAGGKKRRMRFKYANPDAWTRICRIIDPEA